MLFFFFSSRRRHTRCSRDWSSDVCSSDLEIHERARLGGIEPAGGLNPTETRALMDLIVRLREDLRLTLIVVEHDMQLVMGISDRVAVLHYGRKIAEGKPREVATTPAVIEAELGTEEEGWGAPQ